MSSDLYPQIYALVNEIPAGHVATYGQLAEMVGCGPRQVGYALHALPKDTQLPWFRVINREGRISLPPGEGYDRQRQLLELEGVEFDLKGRIDLARFAWNA